MTRKEISYALAAWTSCTVFIENRRFPRAHVPPLRRSGSAILSSVSAHIYRQQCYRRLLTEGTENVAKRYGTNAVNYQLTYLCRCCGGRRGGWSLMKYTAPGNHSDTTASPNVNKDSFTEMGSLKFATDTLFISKSFGTREPDLNAHQ